MAAFGHRKFGNDKSVSRSDALAKACVDGRLSWWCVLRWRGPVPAVGFKERGARGGKRWCGQT